MKWKFYGNNFSYKMTTEAQVSQSYILYLKTQWHLIIVFGLLKNFNLPKLQNIATYLQIIKGDNMYRVVMLGERSRKIVRGTKEIFDMKFLWK